MQITPFYVRGSIPDNNLEVKSILSTEDWLPAEFNGEYIILSNDSTIKISCFPHPNGLFVLIP
jgi:hypothetical protein